MNYDARPRGRLPRPRDHRRPRAARSRRTRRSLISCRLAVASSSTACRCRANRLMRTPARNACRSIASTPGFFKTMGIAIVRGRDFTAADQRRGSGRGDRQRDDGAAFLAGWQTPSASAFRSTAPTAHSAPSSASHATFRSTNSPSVRGRRHGCPTATTPGELVILAAHRLRPPAQVLREIEGAIRGIDANLPLYCGASGSRLRRRTSGWGARACQSFSTICGAVALALAGLGLYGVTAYGVRGGRVKSASAWRSARRTRTSLRLFVREGLQLASPRCHVGRAAGHRRDVRALRDVRRCLSGRSADARGLCRRYSSVRPCWPRTCRHAAPRGSIRSIALRTE